MSYYLLPKNNHIFHINPVLNSNEIPIYTSYSIYHYFYEVDEQLKKIVKQEESNFFYSYEDAIENLYKEFNPYEYIFNKVPGSKYSVSKLKMGSNLYYEFLEICYTLNLLDSFKNTNIKYLHIGKNHQDLVECINLLREHKEDTFHHFCENLIPLEERYEFLFFEMESSFKPLCILNSYGLPEVNMENCENTNMYIIKFVQIIMMIIRHQSNNGSCVIQINHIVHKPIIELLYFLVSLFDKTYLIKPNSSRTISFDKYLVCKNFSLNENKLEIYKKYYNKLNEITHLCSENKGKNISTIIQEELPCYFINKIDDMNIIMGQQQLECMDQMMNVFKNNNKKERIEYIRKVNIQKSVHWCEKFKIPCNKFLEKTNIFLPMIFSKEETIDEIKEE